MADRLPDRGLKLRIRLDGLYAALAARKACENQPPSTQQPPTSQPTAIPPPLSTAATLVAQPVKPLLQHQLGGGANSLPHTQPVTAPPRAVLLSAAESAALLAAQQQHLSHQSYPGSAPSAHFSHSSRGPYGGTYSGGAYSGAAAPSSAAAAIKGIIASMEKMPKGISAQAPGNLITYGLV